LRQRLARLEHALRQCRAARAKLHRAARRLRLPAAALAAAANPAFITDRGGRIVWVNAAFTRLSGYTAAELLDQTPRILKSDKADSALYADLWQTILAGQPWHGHLVDRHKLGSLYTVAETVTPLRDSRRRITHFLAVHEDITAQEENESRLYRLALHDPLTDLPNRLLFGDRLVQALAYARRHSTKVAVLFLDLDGFKAVNDSLGHDVGDQLLRAVANRLRQHMRAEDTVARFGGDEYTLILPGLASTDEAVQATRKILDILTAPFELDSTTVRVTASVGISLYPEDGTEPDVLVKAADLAMYRAKRVDGNSYQLVSVQPPPV
jgi:diguanylate cyclase (GGDEF)-like protein/PAS domain S-box-containing protein